MVKSKCNVCSKELEMDTSIVDTSYWVSWYHSQQPEKKDLKILCENCYQDKEQWYLDNYEYIYKLTNDKGAEFIKTLPKDCYAGKKDQNGKVLKQRDCQHCRPWKKFSEKTCANCGKDISNQPVRNFMRSSDTGIKYWCSSKCMIGEQNSSNSKNNSEDKGMSVGMKIFLGTLTITLVFIIGIVLGKIWQKNKNNKK